MDPRRLISPLFGGHCHALSRRQFFGAATGTALALGLGMPARAARPGSDPTPQPIPGGVSPFGIFIHHFPPSPGVPLGQINDPSQISDFNGFVGVTRIRGVGTGTDTTTGATLPLNFQADMGFMKGEYIGQDERHHHGTFGFIWLDLFTGPVGSGQIHDYNPHIGSNGLFWTIPIPRSTVAIDLDEASASMALEVEVFDDHDLRSSLTGVFPPGFPQAASVAFDVEWEGLIDREKVTNETEDFTGQFILTGATIRWEAVQPGFRFESEAPNPARNVYSVIGHERNGVFSHS